MATKSLFKCCLSHSKSQDAAEKAGCSEDQSFIKQSNKYKYGAGCYSLMNQADNIGGDNNYGYDLFIKQYPDGNESHLLYALHSTNDQITNGISSKKKNMDTRDTNMGSIDVYNGINASLNDFITKNHELLLPQVYCNSEKPYRYYDIDSVDTNKLTIPICYTSNNGSMPKDNEINYDKSDIEASSENGSDLCYYEIDADGNLTETPDKSKESCEKKYLEWNIDKFDDLGVDPTKKLLYPSFTKYAKCRFDNASDLCTIKRKSELNSSYVNECLEHTGCNASDLYANKCSLNQYSLDYLTEKGGYNRQYTHLCGCQYKQVGGRSSEYYNDIKKTAIETICRNYGLTGAGLAMCTDNIYKHQTEVGRQSNQACINDTQPCSAESTVIKSNERCRILDDDSTNFIQICSNAISTVGITDITADMNNKCIQEIKNIDNTTYNNIVNIKESKESTSHTTTPPSTNTTTPPPDDSDYMTYIYYGLGIVVVLILLFLCIKLLFGKREVTPNVLESATVSDD